MTATRTHADVRRIDPPVLYFGTPVALICTLNSDGTPNLAPMSSWWALGRIVVLGLTSSGQTVANLRRTPELTVNLPNPELWEHVERLAPLTGADPVPDAKIAQGFRHESRKFDAAGLSPIRSELVEPPRVAECPVQMEARVRRIDSLPAVGDDEPPCAVHVEVVATYAHANVAIPGTDHVDVDRWRPLLYLYRHYVAAGDRLGATFRAFRETGQPPG